ncbi:MAG TPA: hypothetical protein DCO83_14085 [Mucilaginibacter sp.]|jgi:hypothetical protein|nr:hypothetical protein [Mucilaginibacter sp.]
MISKSVESQAREYVYDVKNCASEYGQSTLEGWEFSLVTDAEKTKIEKNYYPTVAAHPAQEALFELFRLVKSKLLLPLSHLENSFDVNSTLNKNVTCLIAFNPKLHR